MARRRAAQTPTISDLIDPEPGRLEAIWREARRPVLWSLAAFAALGTVVVVGLTERGSERLAALPDEVATVVARLSPSVETRVASRAIPLDEQRQRAELDERRILAARLAELERGLGDVTGSIPRQTGREIPSEQPRLAPAIPMPEERSGAAPAPAQRPAAAPASAGAVTLATRTQFGIDLGPEATVPTLRARWLRLVERHGTALNALDPTILVREGTTGAPVLHLVAGPFADLAEAASLCARLRSSGTTCSPTPYEGQRLAVR
jgi:hypothetical protein